MNFLDEFGLLTASVTPGQSAIVVVFSGEKNSSQAAKGTAYLFSSDQTSSGSVDTKNSTSNVPIVSGGYDKKSGTTYSQAPDGTYINVPTVACIDSPTAAATLADGNHGTTYMPLGITKGAAAGDAVHQSNATVTSDYARSQGCPVVVGNTDIDMNKTKTNYQALVNIIDGKKATVVVSSTKYK